MGIGTPTPAASAALEIRSVNQGLLLPRLTTAQREAIVGPVVGLLVFQTDGTAGVYYYTGSTWLNLTTGLSSEGSDPAALVSTLAGSVGSMGSADGTGAAARFGQLRGVAVDAGGTLYLADASNNTIRRVTAAGVVTTLAGLAGATGSADGVGTAARFTNPGGVAVDAGGNVYVSDQGNSTIRKITPAGAVSTLAGLAGSTGSADGTGSAARFSNPSCIAVDISGTLYVGDVPANTIRKITPAGAVTTLAGLAGSTGSADGLGAAARFQSPVGVAVDAAGTVFVADVGNRTVRKITATGMVTTLAGTAGLSGSTNGTGAAARFGSPNNVAVDGNGMVYVTDALNQVIRKITPTGVVTTLAGLVGMAGSTDGPGTSAQFNQPFSIAVDNVGTLYVGDSNNFTLRVIRR